MKTYLKRLYILGKLKHFTKLSLERNRIAAKISQNRLYGLMGADFISFIEPMDRFSIKMFIDKYTKEKPNYIDEIDRLQGANKYYKEENEKIKTENKNLVKEMERISHLYHLKLAEAQ